MGVGLSLSLGKKTRGTRYTGDDVREDITAAGDVTSWQLEGQDRDMIRDFFFFLEDIKLNKPALIDSPAIQTHYQTSPSRC